MPSIRHDWVSILAPHDRENEIVVMALFAVLGVPPSYFDVGSGTGAMVNLARKIGVDAWGADQIARPQEYLIQHNLEFPLALERGFHLVTCLETAEHLPESAADVLCDTIVRHTKPGGVIVFTAAPPGQAGDGHVNCQPAQYWHAKFWDRGCEWKSEKQSLVQLAWTIANHSQKWLPANVLVFQRLGGQE